MVARPLRAAASLGADGQGIAILYRDDLVGLMPEEPARFLGSRSPTLPVDAHLMTSQQVPVDSSTVSVRFRLDQPRGHEDGASASAMEVGSLQVDVRARKLLVVPTSAVLYSAGPAGHAYVLASAGEGEPFTKRPVEVGRILDSGYLGAFAGRQDGATVILSGLREAERVIGGYAFFSDVERRLRERTGGVMP
jgi:hypothetical protein